MNLQKLQNCGKKYQNYGRNNFFLLKRFQFSNSAHKTTPVQLISLPFAKVQFLTRFTNFCCFTKPSRAVSQQQRNAARWNSALEPAFLSAMAVPNLIQIGPVVSELQKTAKTFCSTCILAFFYPMGAFFSLVHYIKSADHLMCCNWPHFVD